VYVCVCLRVGDLWRLFNIKWNKTAYYKQENYFWGGHRLEDMVKRGRRVKKVEKRWISPLPQQRKQPLKMDDILQKSSSKMDDIR